MIPPIRLERSIRVSPGQPSCSRLLSRVLLVDDATGLAFIVRAATTCRHHTTRRGEQAQLTTELFAGGTSIKAITVATNSILLPGNVSATARNVMPIEGDALAEAIWGARRYRYERRPRAIKSDAAAKDLIE